MPCKCDSSSYMYLEVILQISITKGRVDSDVHVNSVTDAFVLTSQINTFADRCPQAVSLLFLSVR